MPLIAHLIAILIVLPFCANIDFFRWQLGFLICALAGNAMQRWLGLARVKQAALPVACLYGQVGLLAYLYLRFLICFWIPFPGVSSLEIYALIALLSYFAGGQFRIPKHLGSLRNEIATSLVWVAAAAWFFTQKKGLLTLPSSDADLHAYYAKYLLELGRLYYVIPGSDVRTAYPGGFNALNFLWGKLTGLNAVSLVSFQPYWQYLIWLGVGFAWLGKKIGRTRYYPVAALAIAFVGSFTFNPLWVEGRLSYEGTARLAHTGLLLFPLVPPLLSTPLLGARRKLILGLLLFPIAFAAAINPAHLAPGFLIGILALCAWFKKSEFVAKESLLSILWIVFWMAVVVGIDPFYHDKLFPPAILPPPPTGVVTTVPGLVDGSLGLQWFAAWGMGNNILSALPAYEFVLYLALIILSAWRPLIIFFILHLLLALALSLKLSQATVSGTLLVEYTAQALWQTALPLTLILIPVAAVRKSKFRRGLFGLWLVCALAQGLINLIHFRPFLNRSSGGSISVDDILLIKWAETQVPPDERVLLPGAFFSSGFEDWIMPAGGARAWGVYSNTPTAFYYALDGSEFTAAAYRAHIDPVLDLSWLDAHHIYWIYDSVGSSVSLNHGGEFKLAKRFGGASLFRRSGR